MNYQTVEQLFCKVTAADGLVSQGLCWLNFEKQYPPGSVAYADFVRGCWGSAVMLVGLVVFAWAWRGLYPPSAARAPLVRRREPSFFDRGFE